MIVAIVERRKKREKEERELREKRKKMEDFITEKINTNFSY